MQYGNKETYENKVYIESICDDVAFHVDRIDWLFKSFGRRFLYADIYERSS